MSPTPLPYKALALDLDGTLLDTEAAISPLTRRTLHELSGRGVQIILASGRMTTRILPYAAELAIPLGIIAYNGAETLQGQDSNWRSISNRWISPQTRDSVYVLCRDQGVFLNVYAEGKLHGYHPTGDFGPTRIYRGQTGAEYAGMHRELDTLPRENIAKLLAVETPENRDRLFLDWNPLLSKHCSLVKSNPEYLEFVAQGVSKGAALSAWLAAQGLEPSTLAAFGDAENDLEMLNLAGFGIAMGNSTPGLRAAFPRVSAFSHAQDGVARELAALFNLDSILPQSRRPQSPG